MTGILGWVGFVLGGFMLAVALLQLVTSLADGGPYPIGQASTIALGAALCYVGLRAIREGRPKASPQEPPEE